MQCNSNTNIRNCGIRCKITSNKSHHITHRHKGAGISQISLVIWYMLSHSQHRPNNVYGRTERHRTRCPRVLHACCTRHTCTRAACVLGERHAHVHPEDVNEALTRLHGMSIPASDAISVWACSDPCFGWHGCGFNQLTLDRCSNRTRPGVLCEP